MSDTSPVPAGLLLSDDLIFASRIRGAARDLGFAMATARSSAELLELARRSPPRCVLVDLDNPGLEIEALTKELLALDPVPRIVAYGPHVNAELLRQARAAGCEPVLPRSKFVEQLQACLPLWLA
jgi:CheY-like chemotaxis protein